MLAPFTASVGRLVALSLGVWRLGRGERLGRELFRGLQVVWSFVTRNAPCRQSDLSVNDELQWCAFRSCLSTVPVLWITHRSHARCRACRGVIDRTTTAAGRVVHRVSPPMHNAVHMTPRLRSSHEARGWATGSSVRADRPQRTGSTTGSTGRRLDPSTWTRRAGACSLGPLPLPSDRTPGTT